MTKRFEEPAILRRLYRVERCTHCHFFAQSIQRMKGECRHLRTTDESYPTATFFETIFSKHLFDCWDHRFTMCPHLFLRRRTTRMIKRSGGNRGSGCTGICFAQSDESGYLVLCGRRWSGLFKIPTDVSAYAGGKRR